MAAIPLATPFRLQHQVSDNAPNYVFQLAPSNTMTHMAAPHAQGTISIHDLATLSKVATITPAASADTILTQVLFDNVNSDLLFSSDRNGLVALWDLRTGGCNGTHTPVLTWNAYAPILSFDVNSSHTVLAAGSELLGEDANINFWDIRGGAGGLLATFSECHSDDVTQIKFHPTQAEAMISGSTDGLICLYNLSTWEEEDALYQVIKNDSVSKLGFFGPSSEYIYATTHIETMSLWKFLEGDKICVFGDVRGVSEDLKLDYLIDCTYEPVGQRLYATAGSQEGAIGILDVNIGRLELLYTLNGGHTDIVRSTFWDTKMGVFASSSEDSTISLWKQ
ncbi:hypothetical protein BASA50_005501 [Batrachochytrium salamandrivorans]|uniref:Anaphase-promoting complex subunit 4 WD40 domain-containing protein n=1 Tax=Batrachochytrium salamandrivorans TaxID=1357716 RepID=A0ABQ8FCJ6_9FUNG|nr:hypothetical protein BASA60_005043 [Batrachochytrium salamandrivorans]KAH6577737.1 hypothetical protein BASA62_000718 [Batrachochytrium salamandrivorans]KAH6584866.1 hypothetical protein BASA61_007234 [Batrachochytrium salamandrivorans]KAH6595921.1 hypothetical protein BASA50_005501 [Batrachochytrium salamandrivorans]KAH9249284.1 hypothetical protein BASA81_013011 [Batrachochytrium salamandrivorans]